MEAKKRDSGVFPVMRVVGSPVANILKRPVTERFPSLSRSHRRKHPLARTEGSLFDPLPDERPTIVWAGDAHRDPADLDVGSRYRLREEFSIGNITTPALASQHVPTRR